MPRCPVEHCHGGSTLRIYQSLVGLAVFFGVCGLTSSIAQTNIVPATDPAIEYVGHWGMIKKADQTAMVTVNGSSQIYVNFTGQHIVGLFDLDGIGCLEQIVVTVDGGPWKLFTVDKPRIDFFPAGLKEGTHQFELAVKAIDNKAGRWLMPLQSAVSFGGFELDSGARAEPDAALQGQPRLEFIGDAITQGDGIKGTNASSVMNADALASYAWLAGEALGTVHAQIAFPGQGVLTSDSREVPPAIYSFGWNFAGSAAEQSGGPDFLVINLGSNDSGIPSNEFVPAYLDLLQEIREHCPRTTVFAVPPFSGDSQRARDIALAVKMSRDPLVHYLDSTGWVSAGDFTDRAHLNFAGSEKAATQLETQLRPYIDRWKIEHKQKPHSPVQRRVRPQPGQAEHVRISANDPRIAYVGHWGPIRRTSQAEMATINSSSQIYLNFTGTHVAGLFDLNGIEYLAQIDVKVDDGDWTLFTVDQPRIEFFPEGLPQGTHHLEIAAKAIDGNGDRWLSPLRSAIVFAGFEMDSNAKIEPRSTANRKPFIEFLGDSITQGEGILHAGGQVINSDGLATYAWLTGEALGTTHVQVAFGGSGVIRSGSGNVPAAPLSFAWNFAGSPADFSVQPDFILLNLGTNDQYSTGEFIPAYINLLREIRRHCPHTVIFAMRPFHGNVFHGDDIADIVKMMHDPRIVYIDSTGWGMDAGDFTDGAHPNVSGSRKAAVHLKEALRPYISKWTPPGPSPSESR